MPQIKSKNTIGKASLWRLLLLKQTFNSPRINAAFAEFASIKEKEENAQAQASASELAKGPSLVLVLPIYPYRIAPDLRRSPLAPAPGPSPTLPIYWDLIAPGWRSPPAPAQATTDREVAEEQPLSMLASFNEEERAPAPAPETAKEQLISMLASFFECLSALVRFFETKPVNDKAQNLSVDSEDQAPLNTPNSSEYHISISLSR